MGTYCTHYKKFHTCFACPARGLENGCAATCGSFWGRGHSHSYLQVAVSALWAVDDLGWIPHTVTKKVWRCGKQLKD